MGDEILEINGVPIVDQDQKEVGEWAQIYGAKKYFHESVT